MYQTFFGLHSDPFALGPSLRFLYRSQAHAETMAHLGYGLEQGEDFILIVGAIGTGKTLALHSLQSKVSKLFCQVLVNTTSVSYPEFLKLVLHDLGQSWLPGADTADLLCLLKDRALAIHADGQKILLIVDEAQNLDLQTLEAIRLLTNLGQPNRQLFQIVLAGQPALEDLIDHQELAQLRQRIRIHYRLEPLTMSENGEYITHRLAVAGRRDLIFSQAAIARIHELSHGIPRLVNHLASHALLAAFVSKDRRVDDRHVAAEGLPEAPLRVAVATPSVNRVMESTRGPELDADSRNPTASSILEGPATPQPPRSVTQRRQRTRSESQTRAPSWVWVWLLALALVSLGAWSFLRDGPGVSPSNQQTGRLMPPAKDLVPEPAPAGDLTASRPSDGSPSPSSLLDSSLEGTSTQAIGGPTRATAVDTHMPGHWLHVASFSDTSRAVRYQRALDAVGTPVFHRDVQLADGLRWRRILVGPFESPSQAESVAIELEEVGLISFYRLLTD